MFQLNSAKGVLMTDQTKKRIVAVFAIFMTILLFRIFFFR
jgi:hypothetical protein